MNDFTDDRNDRKEEETRSLNAKKEHIIILGNKIVLARAEKDKASEVEQKLMQELAALIK
jgi:hypothetical protein